MKKEEEKEIGTQEQQAAEEEMDALAAAIRRIIREAGSQILRAEDPQNQVMAKEGHANFVTVYDQRVQQFLKEQLLAVRPDAVFVGEEEETHAGVTGGIALIVDPIDGTTNFMRGLRTSAVSIGVLREGIPWMGFVFQPYSQELFWAVRGRGAYCNERPIHASKRALEDGLIIFGTAPYYPELAERTRELIRVSMEHSLDIRRSGSAAIDLCHVASGRAELFYELRLSPWDYAAGALIVQEAGGMVTGVDGEPLQYEHPMSMLAGGRRAREEFCRNAGWQE